MPTAFLDSFQLIVAFYLFYVSIKGSGQMYRFFDISEEDQMRVRLPLRHLLIVCGYLRLQDSESEKDLQGAGGCRYWHHRGHDGGVLCLDHAVHPHQPAGAHQAVQRPSGAGTAQLAAAHYDGAAAGRGRHGHGQCPKSVYLPAHLYSYCSKYGDGSHSDGHYLPVCVGPGSVYSSCGHHPVHLLQHCQMLY